MKRLGLSIALAILFTGLAFAGFSRCTGPTTFEATRDTPNAPFRVRITFQRGLFSTVDAFTSRAYAQYFVTSALEFTELSLEDEQHLRHSILAQGAPALDEEDEFGVRYTDALNTGALAFTWTFSADPLWGVFLLLTVAGPFGGALAGHFLSARRGR